MVGNLARMAGKQFKRVYLVEWRRYAELTQVQLANLLDVTDITISRWERGTRKMNTDDLVVVANVIGRKIGYPLEPQDLFRSPNTLSLDAMLRDSPEGLKKQAEALIMAIKGSGGQK